MCSMGLLSPFERRETETPAVIAERHGPTRLRVIIGYSQILLEDQLAGMMLSATTSDGLAV